jgi:hypothetical protein
MMVQGGNTHTRYSRKLVRLHIVCPQPGEGFFGNRELC